LRAVASLVVVSALPIKSPIKEVAVTEALNIAFFVSGFNCNTFENSVSLMLAPDVCIIKSLSAPVFEPV
jgi:hypothetical protein